MKRWPTMPESCCGGTGLRTVVSCASRLSMGGPPRGHCGTTSRSESTLQQNYFVSKLCAGHHDPMDTATDLGRLIGPLRRAVLLRTRRAEDLPDLPEAQIELLR